MPHDVSVIIPAYNYGPFVGRGIESALGQTRAPAQIVVVDDGSTDDTPEIVSTFGPPVQLVRQENRGVAAARNHGARVATAPLLAFLDADDSWHPRKLELQVERLEREPAVGLVHCGTELVDARGASLGRETNGLEGWVAEELLLLRRSVVLGGGSGALVTKAAFDAVGGFDEQLSTAADWDLYLRIALEFPIAFVPDVLVYYAVHGSAMHLNVERMEHDVLITFDKVFRMKAHELGRLRSTAYSNLYMTLSGSYFSSGQIRRAIACGARSIVHRPQQVRYVLQFPARRLRRHRGRERLTEVSSSLS